jgi:hypothetical protein
VLGVTLGVESGTIVSYFKILNLFRIVTLNMSIISAEWKNSLNTVLRNATKIDHKKSPTSTEIGLV